jgi:NAD+ diphosphatase
MNDTFLILFDGGNLLIFNGNDTAIGASTARLPFYDEIFGENLVAEGDAFEFRDDERYQAVRVATGCAAPEGFAWVGLRESASLLSPHDYMMAAKGYELLNWSSRMRFCGKCGAPLRRNTDISYKCGECGSEYFPQLSPAILVLVRKGDKALLVHARTFKRDFYGLVAGFVETGESLEECVRREVREETSLEIDNIRYFGSQSWPFPSNLMIGFTADYLSGEVRFADGELTSGGFFGKDELPTLPTPPSLALTMIKSFYKLD